MKFSFWEKNTFIKNPDVVIIGSGIVGLFSAFFIKSKSPHLQVLVLERGMLPYGASTRNAGFACYGSPSELYDDLQHHSEQEVFALVEKRWKGLIKLRETLGDKAIEYEPFCGYEVFHEDDTLFNRCSSVLDLLNKNLHHITGEKEMYRITDQLIPEFGFNGIKHIIQNNGEGQIDTGKMMKALLDRCISIGVQILNGVNVESFSESDQEVEIRVTNIQHTNSNDSSDSILTKRLLLCTNGFAKKFLPEDDIQPARAQVLITQPIDNLKVKGCFHFDSGFYYFRNVGKRLLLGGGRNLDLKGEFTEEFGLTSKIQSKLDEYLKEMILPGINFKVDMRWSGIMGLGNQKSPIVKKTGKNIFCAVRLGGMGIAIGSQVGDDASSLILESF